MEVAIMGAGISGLSCAITLEKNGVTPTIFEKRKSVGDRFVNAESLFSILNRPIQDSISYVAENFHIKLSPITEVDKIFLHSKNQVGSVNGKIGYTNIRGRHANSFENQLAKQVKSKINFNSTDEYKDICKKFDYVVLATGDAEYAVKLNNYRYDLRCAVKGVTVKGEFIKSNPHVWFNYEILPKGYGWLIPFSKEEAHLVIVYTDSTSEIDQIWDKFFSLVCKSLDQDLKITDDFQIKNYMVGICNESKIDNTYFIGNCFGAISPGFGFGQFASILTGVYSAYDICGLESYEELVKPLFENYNHSIVFRRFLEQLTDKQIDFYVDKLNNKIIDKVVGTVSSKNNGIDFLRLATPIMKLVNDYKQIESR
ncbi:NAD(P)-binding protein [Alkalibaculum sp. M08DMB]|uniref:NAD(P)-binding protein n=1 Tax=Alkalibaculum sporogenes TaxID=2655001 RepID=A0A6A7K4U5_9FIRM|nr:NAD(P)/FAD-dependent oxidoreductase [Alkalibaculum sporogenes]MPW24408.1 NAD(P)-binding protein [Alkalibaculum sporogenes]